MLYEVITSYQKGGIIMDDFERIINSLSDKEIILRVDMKQNIKIINFKIVV